MLRNGGCNGMFISRCSSNTWVIASNARDIINNEYGRMYKKESVAYFKELVQNLLGGRK
jgi:hypothetical protein